MLIYQYSAVRQRLEAVAVKLLCEKSLAGAEGVGGIHYDKVIFTALSADVFKTVLKKQVYSRVIELAGCLWEILLADFHHLFIYLHHIDICNGFIAGQLADSTAVTRTDDQYILDIGIYSHRHGCYHLMVDIFVLFSQHDEAVKHQHPPEFVGIEYIDLLIIALTRVELLLYLYSKINIVRMLFSKPKIHGVPSLLFNFSTVIHYKVQYNILA